MLDMSTTSSRPTEPVGRPPRGEPFLAEHGRPDDVRGVQGQHHDIALGADLGGRSGVRRACCGQRRGGFGSNVVHGDRAEGGQQPLGDRGAHHAEPDHSGPDSDLGGCHGSDLLRLLFHI
jgi:hypothetical protein